MKPRRETGAVLVSPMTSEVNTGDVNMGSVLIRLLLQLFLGRRIQRILACELQITWLREAARSGRKTDRSRRAARSGLNRYRVLGF
jgi:hypothetical protein